MISLPAPTDVARLLARLGDEERRLERSLVALEDRLRRFLDLERPAYERWRKLEFGPLVVTLEELSAELRLRRVSAERVTDLVERHGLDPREALHVVTTSSPQASRVRRRERECDEIDARRRVRLERKRAARRETARAKRDAVRDAERAAPAVASDRGPARQRLVRLYRGLARRLHPDSPEALRSLAPERRRSIWAEVQAAYAAASLERLLAVSAWIDAASEGGPTTDAASEGRSTAGAAALEGAMPGTPRPALLTLAERFARLRALRRSRRSLEGQIARLEADPAWGFGTRRAGAARAAKQRARAAIEGEIARVRRALEDLEQFFASIGKPRPPSSARTR
jgi:hypothetical protein